MRPTPEQTQAAIESACIGIWSYTMPTGRVVWSPEVEQRFGVTPGTFAGT